MAKPQTASELAEKITRVLMEQVEAKLDRFMAGDHTAVLSSEEIDFVFKAQKAASEKQHVDNQSAYLDQMDTAQLDEFLKRVDDSLVEDA